MGSTSQYAINGGNKVCVLASKCVCVCSNLEQFKMIENWSSPYIKKRTNIHSRVLQWDHLNGWRVSSLKKLWWCSLCESFPFAILHFFAFLHLTLSDTMCSHTLRSTRYNFKFIFTIQYLFYVVIHYLGWLAYPQFCITQMYVCAINTIHLIQNQVPLQWCEALSSLNVYLWIPNV